MHYESQKQHWLSFFLFTCLKQVNIMLHMQQTSRLSHAERTDLSDKLMLESAIDLIVSRGTAKTTLKEVGELAGYSRGLAGYRFGSKTGLFQFVLRSVGEEWLQSLKLVTKKTVGMQAITNALREHCNICISSPKHIRAFYILWFESIGSESVIKETVANIQARRRNDVINWIENSNYQGKLNSGDLAEQFNASVLGIAYQWLANPNNKHNIIKLHDNLIITMQKHFD